MMLRCDQCPAEAVVVEPGTEAPRVLDLFLEQRGAPMRCWCMAHWVAAFLVPVDEVAA